MGHPPSSCALVAADQAGTLMFEPRLHPDAKIFHPGGPSHEPAGENPAHAAAGGPQRVARLGELRDPRDVAPFEEWGHAVEAPTNDAPPRPLGMFPFTP